MLNLFSWTVSQSQWWQDQFFYCNESKSFQWFYVLTIGYMTSMTQNPIFLNLLVFSYYWLLLNSYHIIQSLIAPTGLKITFSGSQMKFKEKSLCFKWLQPFLLTFSYWIFGFCLFVVVVFIVIRLIAMLHWSNLHNKFSIPPTGAYWSVFLLPLKAIVFNGC